MAKTSRKAQVFALGIMFVTSATSLALGISSLEAKGVAFTSCRVSGCRTNLALTVLSGIVAFISLLGLLAVCLGGSDDSNPYKD